MCILFVVRIRNISRGRVLEWRGGGEEREREIRGGICW